MEEPEAILCDPCFKKEPAEAVRALWFPSGVPMYDACYELVCKVCKREWAHVMQMGSHLVNLEICEACESAEKKERARRDAYNAHLNSKEWWKIKKELRKESFNEHGKVMCSRCGMSEYDNKQTYGEGLHGHHRTYGRFGQEKPEDAELLCSECHASEHGKPVPRTKQEINGY